jgi:hypothetical protein
VFSPPYIRDTFMSGQDIANARLRLSSSPSGAGRTF